MRGQPTRFIFDRRDSASMDDDPIDLIARTFRDVPAAVVVTDANFRIVGVSEGSVEFTGFDRDELVDEPALVLAGDRESFTEMAEALANGEAWQGEFVVRRKDGRIAHGTGSSTTISDRVGRVVGAVGVFTDTTKRRRYENASKVLGRLMRHDLRNDLNVLGGRVESALGTAADPATRRHLELALDAVIGVVDTVERARDLRVLLDRSSSQATRPVRLDEHVAGEVAAARERFPDARIDVETLPPVAVLADALLGTVVETLLENAVEHNPADRPRVVVSTELTDEVVVLTVADDGPGVPPDQRRLVFGREERTQLHHGSGFSLFVADTVVEEYGGRMWVEDADLGGAAFRVRLARTAEPADAS